MKYLRKQLLKQHTSFRIGGTADYFCVPKSLEELKEALAFAKEKKLAIAIMGAGSNLLVLDKGFRGLVIKLANFDSIKISQGKLITGSGVYLPKLVSCLARKGWANLEFLAGIPGTIGGAVIMNAEAWKTEIGKYVKQVKALDRDGNEKVLTKKELGFAYRSSKLMKRKLIVYEVTLNVRKDKKHSIKKRIQENFAKRRAFQPLGMPNCGSVFKNPEGKSAGKLIEAAGCKGIRAGDAQISKKHANFIVNLGEAKAKDVIKLIALAQKAVRSQFKIKLEPEIKIMVNYEPY